MTQTITHGCCHPEVWEPNPDRPGFLRLAYTKTVGEVLTDLRRTLGGNSECTDLIDGVDEYFHAHLCSYTEPWPPGRIAVFAVTGGSEGHYIHVEVLGEPRHHDRFLGFDSLSQSERDHAMFVADYHESRCLILGKTFAGWEAAWKAAERIAFALGV